MRQNGQSPSYCHPCFPILFHCCSLECLTGWVSSGIKEGVSKILQCGCHDLRQLLVLAVSSLGHQKFDPISFKTAKFFIRCIEMTKVIICRIPHLTVQTSITEGSISGKFWKKKKQTWGLSYCHQAIWKCSEVSLGTTLQFWKNYKIPPAEVFQMNVNQNTVKMAGNRHWA